MYHNNVVKPIKKRLLIPAASASNVLLVSTGRGNGQAMPHVEHRAAPDDGQHRRSPPAPHLRWDLHGPAVKVAVAGNVVVAVIFFVAIVWRLFFSGKDQDGAVAPVGADGGRVAPAANASSSGASSPCASPRATGLREEDLMALPVYVHAASAEEGGGKVECAVCLSELRDGDTGRLLPRCGHRFHAECVDRWFRSHAACPLCRAVVAGGGSGEVDPKVQTGV